MKNLFLSLALVLVSSFAFANETVKEVSNEIEINQPLIEKEIVKINNKEYMCVRTCYYQNGQLYGCTAWTCYELITLNEITVYG